MFERIVDLPVFQKVEEIVEVVHISHLDFFEGCVKSQNQSVGFERVVEFSWRRQREFHDAKKKLFQ